LILIWIIAPPAAIALLPRLIRRLRRPVSWVEVGDLNRKPEEGEAVTIIDVRGPDEFIGPLGHIAGARNIPVGDLNARLSELAGLKRRPIVLVCRTDKRSAAASQILHDAGFAHVTVLRRGMEQWNEAGLPVEGRAGVAVQTESSPLRTA
jgi:rhodanese-related sulfurtransferase